MANFTRFSKTVEKTPDKRVVSVTVSPVVINCTGRIWFTDLCLQEGSVLSGYHPNPEIFLKKLRVDGGIKPPVWFNGVVRSKETVVLFNLGKTSAPLDIHIYPTADMEAGSITLCQGVGGQWAKFPNAIEKDADLALLAEAWSCTKDGEPEQKEGFYQYSAAWDSKHTVTLEDKKSARVLFSMQEMEDYIMPILEAEPEPEPEPDPEELIDSNFITVIQLDKEMQYTTNVYYFTAVSDAAAMVSDNPDFQYAVIIGENAGVSQIGNYAFEEIKNLYELRIPDCVSTIGSHICYNCTGLHKLRLPNNPKFTQIPANICGHCESLEAVEIPDCVYSVGAYAFSYTGIQSITFSNNLQVIQNSAFIECKNLKEITLPDSMRSIEQDAFAWCENLEEITLNEGLQSIGVRAFIKAAITSIVIPPSVQAILYQAFQICTSLQNVTLQEGLSYIGEAAFYGTGLRAITIPSTVGGIDRDAFSVDSGVAITVLKPENSIAGAPWGKAANTVIWQG